MPFSIARLQYRLLLLLCAVVGWVHAAAAAPEAAALQLSPAHPAVAVWPAVRVLVDPGGALDWRTALSRLGDFHVPAGPSGNFGHQREPVWLALPLQVADGDGRWVFDIDYPPLNEARLYLVADGALVHQVTVGSALPFAQRPMHTRSHAAMLTLTPGRHYQLLVRVRTDSAMVLPMSLSTPDAYHAREAGSLVEQGLVLGISLALLAYCLVHGLILRDSLFGLYGGLLLGSSAFLIDFFGLGQQFLWSQRQGLTALISPLSVLLAMAAGGAFLMRALDSRRISLRLHRGLVLMSGTAGLVLVAGLLGLLDYRSAQMMASLLGPFVPMLGIPLAWMRARQGDRMAAYMLIGWTIYVLGTLCLIGLLRGLLPANFWTLHLFQWASLLEMLAWLRVLGLHSEAAQAAAQRDAAAVRDLSVIARTDALTGLPNRRGLDTALSDALTHADSGRLLAIFMIDLDGFKAVNDQHGHAVGDQLLVEVGRRLVRELRRSDTVARLGGDEFVVVAEALDNEAQAELIGRKLLDAFALPVMVGGHTCRIGLTIGYALAPNDGRAPSALLRVADQAMYAGKRAGRHRVQRGPAQQLTPA
jgi:diguanylate cyclase (GGDEF)-like protein